MGMEYLGSKSSFVNPGRIANEDKPKHLPRHFICGFVSGVCKGGTVYRRAGPDVASSTELSRVIR